ncbi:hypothetical protein [Roseobacter sp. S98]|uniref:hypothetical protein n=1 Tax=Roseobacter algicola (ex Choi et al. 2025) (nom. illeg.) TaxID=3092138 RepID=UPI0035C74D36
MLGWKIFAHSVRMVLGNFRQVLHITVGPALIAVAAIVALFFVAGVPREVFDENAGTIAHEPSAGFLFLAAFVVVPIFFLIVLWIAVAWHRFILLEEYPDQLLPPFRFDRILAYLGRSFLLGLIGAAFMLPVMFVGVAFAQSAPLLGVPVLIVFILVIVLVFYRLSIILPAAAVGKPLPIGEAWAATRGETGTFIALLVVSLLFQLVVQIAFTLLAFVPVLGALLVVFASLLVLPMINVSILTTLYGVYIEKRELT